MSRVKVATIGFTKTTAERFFERLSKARIRKVIDVRLHNTSQFAGFAKADDLGYFLSKIANIDYCHEPYLAPTDAMLAAYKKQKGEWPDYEASFLRLMAERQIEQRLKPDFLDGACLLCSEDKPHRCHRRLVCDYLNSKWGAILDVSHL